MLRNGFESLQRFRFIFALHLVFAVALNFPSLGGMVPISADLARAFPPWEATSWDSAMADRDLGDLFSQIYPWRMFAAESLRDGKLPLWNFHTLGGAPFVANAQSGVFYPLNWLYILLPIPLAWTLLFILRTALAGTFATVFAASIGIHPVGAFCTGLIFEACGFMTVWRGYPMGDAAIWLPLACYAVLRLTRQPAASSLVIAAVAFAMPVLAGHPETAAHIGLVVLILAVFNWFRLPVHARRRYVLLFGTAVALSVGLASAQIFPTLEWLRESAASLEWRWPSKPLHFALMLVDRDISSNPNGAGIEIPGAAAYIGITTVLLASVALRRSSSALIWFTAAIAYAAAAVVYGIEPVHWFSTKIPVLNGIKNGRLIMVTDFCFAVLAGYGLSRLLELWPTHEGELRQARSLLVNIGVAGVVVAGSLWRVYHLTERNHGNTDFMRASLLILAVSGVLIVLRVTNYLSAHRFAAAISGLIAVEMGTFSFAFVPFVPANKIFPPSPVFDFLRENVRPGDRVASVGDTYPPNTEIVYHLNGLGGYDIPLLKPKRLFSDFYDGGFTGINFSPNRVESLRDHRLDMMGVRYLVTTVRNESADRLSHHPDRFRWVYSYGTTRIFENLQSMSALSLIPVSEAEVIRSDLEQLARVHSPDFDPRRSVVVSHLPTTFPFSSTASHSDVSDIKISSNQVEATVHVGEPSIAVLNTFGDTGWSVEVDGILRPIVPANYALMGVALGSGAHRLIFSYRPASVYAGMYLSLFTALILVALLGHAKLLSDTSWLTLDRAAAAAAVLVLSVSVISLIAITQFSEPEVHAAPPAFEISRAEVIAGRDSYVIRIRELAGLAVSIRYSLNGGPVQTFTTLLNQHGESRFEVSANTPKGTYRFLSFALERSTTWMPATATLTVK